jgi:hypothetical protein
MNRRKSGRDAGDAFRAGVATGFVLLGASIVVGTMATGPARLVLALSAPLLAVGVAAYAIVTGLAKERETANHWVDEGEMPADVAQTCPCPYCRELWRGDLR